MTTAVAKRGRPVIWMLGAAAWLGGPLAISVSNALEQTRPWEGLPLITYLVGTLFFAIGGVAVLLAIFQESRRDGFGVRSWIGIGLVVVGLVISGIATWAIPIWSGLYGVGLLVLASSGVFRAAGRILGAAFLAAPATLLLLTELEVGRRDSYGDYPVAWSTALWVAGIGAAIGLWLWSKSDLESAEEFLSRA